MPDNNNAARNMIYREAVAQTFALAGLTDAAPAPRQRLTPENWEIPQGSIVGLRDAEVVVQAAVNSRPADGLADAEAAAANAGKPFGVFVMSRPERPVAESYAVLSLASLALLLADREAER